MIGNSFSNPRPTSCLQNPFWSHDFAMRPFIATFHLLWGKLSSRNFYPDCLLAAKWIEMCVLFFVSVFSRAVGVFVFWDTTSWTILNDFKLKGCRADTPNLKCLDGAELRPKGAKRRKTYLLVLYVFRKMYAALERASCGQNISKEADYVSNAGYL